MRRRTLAKTAACFAVGAILSNGCEKEAPAPRAKPSPTPPVAMHDEALHAEAPAKKVAPPKPPRPPLVLESAEQALDEMIAAVDERRTGDYQEIEGYLHSRGPEIVPLIETRLESGELSTAGQIALVRQLSSAGEPALPTLEKLTSAEHAPIVRMNAIDQISRVRPATDRATNFLRSILREGDPRDRGEALKALDRMGANSPEFIEDLRAIMASDAPEDLRKRAKQSLDRANPRRTFEDRD